MCRIRSFLVPYFQFSAKIISTCTCTNVKLKQFGIIGLSECVWLKAAVQTYLDFVTDYEATTQVQALFTSEASLTFVDLH